LEQLNYKAYENKTLKIVSDYLLKRNLFEYSIEFFTSIAYNQPKNISYVTDILLKIG